MSQRELRLFEIGPGRFCESCPWREECGAAETTNACGPNWGSPRHGGEFVLHPALPLTRAYLRAVRGPSLDDVSAKPVPVCALPEFLPQIRMRSALRGFLNEEIYAVRAREVVGVRRRILKASELRSFVGLSSEQRIVVLLFDHDRFLERLWDHAPRLIPEIASAGYDLIVAPSYSAWSPRPRTEFLYNAKRSMIAFKLLQRCGATTIPRVVWEIGHDVERFATWFEQHPDVEMAALDMQTYRASKAREQQLQGLLQFDELTGRRLVYLINGVTTTDRCVDLFRAIPQARVRLTSTIMASPPHEPLSEPRLSTRNDDGLRFRACCSARRAAIQGAAEAVASEGGVDLADAA